MPVGKAERKRRQRGSSGDKTRRINPLDEASALAPLCLSAIQTAPTGPNGNMENRLGFSCLDTTHTHTQAHPQRLMLTRRRASETLKAANCPRIWESSGHEDTDEVGILRRWNVTFRFQTGAWIWTGATLAKFAHVELAVWPFQFPPTPRCVTSSHSRLRPALPLVSLNVADRFTLKKTQTDTRCNFLTFGEH